MEYGPVFGNAIKQFDVAAVKLKDVPKDLLEAAKKPKRSLIVNIPVKMDNGKIKVFTGFRVQFNDSRGPTKGGIRFHPNVSLDEVTALSFWMTVKNTVAGVPYGGGKGGIIVNPKELSEGELERLSRNYIKAIHQFVGEKIDVPAPDVYTTPQIMAWMMDEFEKIKGLHTPGVITGKPIVLGGSLGRDKATAQGGLFVLMEAIKACNITGKKIAIQGFGNAGAVMAELANNAGFKVIAVSDSKGGILNESGLDIEKLTEFKESKGSVKGFPGSKEISNEELLALECDVLVPAALESVITKENASKVKAKMILELANGPTTPEADEILNKKGIHLIPDVLANSGGVTVSYFEWVQNLYGYYWTKEEVNEKLRIKMVQAFNNLLSTKNAFKCSFRESAYIFAIKEITDAMKLKGFY
ncbi:MAG: Glu/Leu/Phe/Val dehydrogenase [Candidatus Diapherotrites archaeon]|nr:Glu/Leu/Phe/Val dehydrogenase [Candidatus Diapherotrites archaeon]